MAGNAEAREIGLDSGMRETVGFGERHARAPAGEHHGVLAGIRAELQNLRVAKQRGRQHQLVGEQFAPLGGIGLELCRRLEISERRQDVLALIILEELVVSHSDDPIATQAARARPRYRTARKSRRDATDASGSLAGGHSPWLRSRGSPRAGRPAARIWRANPPASGSGYACPARTCPDVPSDRRSKARSGPPIHGRW